MNLSAHAARRWSERFGTLSAEREWIAARLATKRQRRAIAGRCKAHAQVTACRKFNGYYYQVSPSGVVFVCATGEYVVTVFPITEVK